MAGQDPNNYINKVAQRAHATAQPPDRNGGDNHVFDPNFIIFHICGKARHYRTAAPCPPRSLSKAAKNHRVSSLLDGRPNQGAALGKSGALYTRRQRKTTLNAAYKELRAYTAIVLSDQRSWMTPTRRQLIVSMQLSMSASKLQLSCRRCHREWFGR